MALMNGEHKINWDLIQKEFESLDTFHKSFQAKPSALDAISKQDNKEARRKMASKVEPDYFPIVVERVVFEHKSGTKYYRVIKIVGQTGENLLVFQYGAGSGQGQTKVQVFTDITQMGNAFENKISERMRKGYSVKRPHSDPRSRTFDDFEKMKNFLGVPTIAKIGGDNIKKLIPNVKGMFNAPSWVPGHLDEDGYIDSAKVEKKRIALMEQAKIEREKIAFEEQLERKKQYEENPKFGMF